MRRSLSVIMLAPLLVGTLSAVPSQAATTGESAAAAPRPGVWKSTAPRRPAVPVPAASAPSAAQRFADRVLVLTNAERSSRGLAPLALSVCADRYADLWSLTQAQRDAMSHQPLAPIAQACAAPMVGENVGYGNVTPEQMVAMWMASAGHRANLLRPEYTHLGVGAAATATGRWYGTQVFARL